MKHDVFISYSRKDLSQVEPIVKDIEQKTNIKCWIDWNGIESGSQFEDVIIEAIDSVDVVLFFISDNSLNSEAAKLEVNYAYNTKKKVVPIVLDGKALRNWFLFKFGAVDYIDISQSRQYDKLIRDLRSWCGTAKPQSAPEPESAPEPIRAKSYKVGDYYDDGKKQGVVFEVTADGKHGKIVSLTESKELQWAYIGQRRFVGANDEENGAINMAKVQQIAGWREKYPAFAWCSDLGGEWYLPAKEELRCIYRIKDILNVELALRGRELTDHCILWSSTEEGATWWEGSGCAWIVFVRDGNTHGDYKNYRNYVRAVSVF